MLELLQMFTSELLFTLIVPGLFAGIGLVVVGWFLPDILAQYKIPGILLGVFLVLFFTYQSGRYAEFTKNKIQILEQQAEIAKLNAKSGEVTIETIIEYRDKIKYVEKIKEVPINVYIPTEADRACHIDDITGRNIRMLINSSNKGELPSAPIRINGSTK